MTWNGGLEWLLEVALIVLLAATLFHALRLERALGVLKRDRAVLEELVAGFNDSTRQAETGIERLRSAADGAGRQIAKQVDAAGALREDIVFLIERGERLADRLDALVRAGRPLAPDPARPRPPGFAPGDAWPDAAPASAEPRRADPFRPPATRADLEQHYLARLEAARPPAERPPVAESPAAEPERIAPPAEEPAQGAPRLRSQAERDLLKALRTAR
jgi:hypothetical protein